MKRDVSVSVWHDGALGIFLYEGPATVVRRGANRETRVMERLADGRCAVGMRRELECRRGRAMSNEVYCSYQKACCVLQWLTK